GVSKLDTYGGLMLAYNNVKWKDDSMYADGYPHSNSYGRSHVGLSAFLGVRYYLTENLGAQLEFGYGVSLASLGITYKF
nr:hypothetical protein [Bacteroidota bacterium]